VSFRAGDGAGKILFSALVCDPRVNCSEVILNTTDRALRLNVGFLLSAGVGFSRAFDFHEPYWWLGDDFTLEDLQGKVRFTRTHQGLYAEGELTGQTLLECVSCLSEYSQPLTIQLSDLFVYPPPPNPPDPLLVVGEDGFLDLGPLAREAMLLEIPIRAMCRPDCKGLCPVCGSNRNEEACQHPDEDIDPRLSVLRTLLEN